MPRRKYTPRKTVLMDPKYDDFEIARFINSLMVDGKKLWLKK